MSLHLDSDGIDLRSYLAAPPGGVGNSGLVLCHGFPQAPREAASAGLRYGELADRIAESVGMAVLTFNFRGTGQSEGDFSLGGWCSDLAAAISHLRNEEGVRNVWLAGFGTGASIAIHGAGMDPEVRGVAAFSARAHFDDWADNWELLLEHAKSFGMIRGEGFPPDASAWAQEMRVVRPVDSIVKVPPRPILLVHGADDERVPVSDARLLTSAAGGNADLRVIPGAAHKVRHDPRIVALLLGWLDEQKYQVEPAAERAES